MECNLEYFGHIHQKFDDMDFVDFVFKHEWLVAQREKEQNQENGTPGMISLNDIFAKMQSGKE